MDRIDPVETWDTQALHRPLLDFGNDPMPFAGGQRRVVRSRQDGTHAIFIEHPGQHLPVETKRGVAVVKTRPAAEHVDGQLSHLPHLVPERHAPHQLRYPRLPGRPVISCSNHGFDLFSNRRSVRSITSMHILPL